LFQRWILSRLWLTFVALGAGFFAFGAATFNLGHLFLANSRLLGEYGWQAVMGGAIWQSIELVTTGYTGMAAYVVLKTCGHRLSNWLGASTGDRSARRPMRRYAPLFTTKCAMTAVPARAWQSIGLVSRSRPRSFSMSHLASVSLRSASNSWTGGRCGWAIADPPVPKSSIAVCSARKGGNC
jgi:hypothetical protein